MLAMAKREDIEKVLKEVMDPELMMDVVSLGFIYDIKIDGKKAFVTMTLTFPGCPYGPTLVDEIRQKVLKVKGIEKAEVEVTFEPPWEPPKDLRAMYGV
jgi:metal-sulfur cluster biosynthetic enzyme